MDQKKFHGFGIEDCEFGIIVKPCLEQLSVWDFEHSFKHERLHCTDIMAWLENPQKLFL